MKLDWIFSQDKVIGATLIGSVALPLTTVVFLQHHKTVLAMVAGVLTLLAWLIAGSYIRIERARFVARQRDTAQDGTWATATASMRVLAVLLYVVAATLLAAAVGALSTAGDGDIAFVAGPTVAALLVGFAGGLVLNGRRIVRRGPARYTAFLVTCCVVFLGSAVAAGLAPTIRSWALYVAVASMMFLVLFIGVPKADGQGRRAGTSVVGPPNSPGDQAGVKQ